MAFSDERESSRPLNRRQFLKTSALGAIGAGWGGKRAQAQAVADKTGAPRIKEYRVLGRTGFKVSDIGAGSIMNDAVLRAALDAGVNYLDTAEQYPGHHRIVAKAVKDLDRKSLFITTKLEVLEDKSKEGFLKRARKCFEDLNTEYVDCLMMHMPEKAELLKTPGFHEAMAELKAEGRVRFVGVSNHGSFWFRDPEETMEKILMAAAEDGRFDVFLMAYNFLQMDQSGRVLDVCRERKIGVALMKAAPITIYYSLQANVERTEKAGKKVNPLYADGLKRYKDKLDRAQTFIRERSLRNPEEIRDAAIQFVLSHPGVHTVCCLVQTFDEIASYLKLSGSRLGATAEAKLEAYRTGCGDLYCRHACGSCEPSCPHGVPVNTIMRFYHYFAGQRREKESMGLYAAIPGARADACAGCSGFCESVCPHHVPIQGMLLAAHDQLTLP